MIKAPQAQADLKIASEQLFTPAYAGALQRKCACGRHALGGACDKSTKEQKPATLQRSSTNAATSNDVPPVVHYVLRSSGQPLDDHTRHVMEPRFGHDFSRTFQDGLEGLIAIY